VELLPEELSVVMVDYFQAISASLGQ